MNDDNEGLGAAGWLIIFLIASMVVMFLMSAAGAAIMAGG